MTARGGRRIGAGRKPAGAPLSRFQFWLNPSSLAQIDCARSSLRENGRVVTRSGFLRGALSWFLGKLTNGLPFQSVALGAGAKHFPIMLADDLRVEAERAVAAGLAPSVSALLRAAAVAAAKKIVSVEFGLLRSEPTLNTIFDHEAYLDGCLPLTESEGAS